MTRLALIALLALAGCDGPLSLLTGGGPNVAANVQAARTATQTVGTTVVQDTRVQDSTAGRDIVQTSDTNRVRADQVQTVVVQEVPAWLIIAFAVALFLDSPLRWPGQIWAGIRRQE